MLPHLQSEFADVLCVDAFPQFDELVVLTLQLIGDHLVLKLTFFVTSYQYRGLDSWDCVNTLNDLHNAHLSKSS